MRSSRSSVDLSDDIIRTCFLCGGVRFETSWWLHYGSTRLIRCSTCALLHIYPVRHHADGAERLDAEETARQAGMFDAADPVSFDHGNGILDLVQRYRTDGRVLDVGCKFGDLLEAARRRGWEAVGLDLNPAFCEIARSRGFTVYNDIVERLGPAEEGFDLIVMSHVLEHIERPDITLKAVYERLNPHGLLYVETPDVSSPIAWGVYRGRWLGVATPGHVWAFTAASLERVVRTAGFHVLWRNRWIPYAPHDYPRTVKGQGRRVLFSFIRAIGYGDIVGLLAQKPDDR
jgi:2-polyprenyl-3-methyl-5-hydroxy-6-metoxy-1,4-benzoquinol methylase